MSLRHLLSRRLVVSTVALATAAAPLLAAVPAHADTAPYTKTAVVIKVTSPGCPTPANPGYQPSVAADLYVPDGVDKDHRAPAILATNGFGGDKSDQAGIGDAFARHGYVVLSYSGLGFGGSSCRITLDDREHDGLVGSQLLDFLGGKPGIGFVDPRGSDTSNPAYHGPATFTGAPVTVDAVIHDATDHAGVAHTYDPRVGMIGGSYGGQIQFAIAGRDARLDTIVPIITWNDLSYSLAPNNAGLAPGTVTYSTPGTAKVDWTGLFFADGQAQGQSYLTEDPTDRAAVPTNCPNFDPRACTALAQETSANYPNATTTAFIRHASVHTYIGNIRIPTFLAQGQADTLFNLQESVATYRQLKAQGTPVKLLWQSWGHSNSTPVPGELSLSRPDGTYEGGLFQQWFDHYLKGTGPAPALDFRYFRDYAYTAPNAAAAYAVAPSYPVGTTQRLYLSGPNALTPARSGVRAGAARFGTPGGGVPLSQSYTAPSADTAQPTPPSDAPGTFAAYDTKPLSADVDSVGVPTLDVRLSSPTAEKSQQLGAAGKLVLFAKIYDVAPDGTVTLVHRLISPVRVPDVTKPLHVELPGVVHRYAKGHRLRLVVAASDASYQNNRSPQVVSILTSPAAPGVLTLPVLTAAGGAFGPATVTGGSGAATLSAAPVTRGAATSGSLASTGLPAGLPLVALGVLLVAAAVRHWRRPAARLVPGGYRE